MVTTHAREIKVTIEVGILRVEVEEETRKGIESVIKCTDQRFGDVLFNTHWYTILFLLVFLQQPFTDAATVIHPVKILAKPPGERVSINSFKHTCVQVLSTVQQYLDLLFQFSVLVTNYTKPQLFIKV